ncbi:FAD-dependent monooxygenase [Nonomuraea cavernae]|uniref:FAD-binding domain-containing protein n=1 Tax=Nonomuraea cavernae TaxID=2045107 RepID=A0A917ZHE6_9ACTN|nr:FAD-dependent monooxygenase [Nonomuraea cavernae]MCA2189684.1 FAD-dependent monooxygenase [Nonomuraea cavernae]GGO83110.1 hypothetical protein GCM10012289_75900 [Nonomuraea cavernae]
MIHIDICDLDPLPSYVRALLAGTDAAHAMSPARGQGAGQSIEDAFVLAAALVGEGAIEGALRRYDAERRPRTQATARGAPAPMGAAPPPPGPGDHDPADARLAVA